MAQLLPQVRTAEATQPKRRRGKGEERVAVVQTAIPPVINYSKLFIKTFCRAWNDIQEGVLRKFWFKGGRASFKSSFIAFVIILGMMADARKANKARLAGEKNWKRHLSHAVIFRKYGVDIHDSTYETIRWAIQEVLGYGALWHFAKTGRRATFLPTGQMILFRGLDDAQKTKSIKAPFGWYKYTWFEELTEYANMKEIRTVEQSVQRGGHHFITLCSYNPPPTMQDWVNDEAAKTMDGRKIYHSTFLDAAKYAPQWLGEDFFKDAKALLKNNEMEFRHEYLGEITGTGSEVFRNVRVRTIKQEELNDCIVHRHGLDFGFEDDPCALMSVAYNPKKRTLYIYGEWVKKGQFEEQIYREIERRGLLNKLITADCAESRAIARLNQMGARKVIKCTKGPNSVEDGLHWLRSLNAIIIDTKCTVAQNEFLKYEWKKTPKGENTSQYVDKNNHTIDAVRYALETEIRYGDAPHKWGVV